MSSSNYGWNVLARALGAFCKDAKDALEPVNKAFEPYTNDKEEKEEERREEDVSRNKKRTTDKNLL